MSEQSDGFQAAIKEMRELREHDEEMRERQNAELGQHIAVIDPPMYTGDSCCCGEMATHVLIVSNHQIHLCSGCLSEVGKRVIDGLM